MAESRQQEPDEEEDKVCVMCGGPLYHEIQYCGRQCREADDL